MAPLAFAPDTPAGGHPHAASVSEVAAALHVDTAQGLSAPDVADRRLRHGPNEIRPIARPSIWSIVRESASEPFVVLLSVAGVLAIILGEVRDGALVLLGLLPIVGADVLTTYRSERALESLRAAAAPAARVRRDSAVHDLPAADLVPGDVVLLRAGEIVPADLRLVTSDRLLIDRSALTGESMPELASAVPDPVSAALPERRAVVYAGTAVVGGRGEGIVIATGSTTEVGRIAGTLARTERRRSPLQRELDRLVRILLVVAIALIGITSGLGLLRGNSLGANVLAGISAAIAAIPEEPPVLLAVILGLGAYRLLRRGVLVRRLSAEETLGAVDLVITDKTGTLTANRLGVRGVLTPSGSVDDPTDRKAVLNLAIRAEEDAWHVAAGARPGSFTVALMAEAGIDRLADADHPRLVSADGPADGRPWSSTWTRDGTRLDGLAIGAPEAVFRLVADDAVDLGPWRELVEQEARAGGRLLLLARATQANDWRPVAIIVFADPLRDGVAEAIQIVRRAGIQTIVVTGDHPVTAGAIARAAGIDHQSVISGSELSTWSDDEVARRLPDMAVVARAVPEDKLRLVDLARAAGRTVAVTGDGINDAPALQHADVAVAMGSGTAVAKDASDLILGDDSFATLTYGLREGRRIVANVQKGLVFLTSTHVALLGFILIATLAGISQPLLPIQILWLELFIDASTSIAFEREPEEPDAMSRPPRPRDRPLLDAPLLGRISLAGGFSAVAALALMLLHDGTADHLRWLAFSALVIAQVVRAYANRSLSRPVVSLRSNGVLLVACLAVIAIQILIPLLPPLAAAFHATSLDPTEWGLVAVIALAPAAVAELVRATGRVWVA